MILSSDKVCDLFSRQLTILKLINDIKVVNIWLSLVNSLIMDCFCFAFIYYSVKILDTARFRDQYDCATFVCIRLR